MEAIHVARIVEGPWHIFRVSLIEAKTASASIAIADTAWIEKNPEPGNSEAMDPKTILNSPNGEYLRFQAFEDHETPGRIFDMKTPRCY